MKTIEEVKEILEYSEKYNIWENPTKKVNENTNGDECEYCGRKCGKNPLTVHITTDGTCLPNDVTEDDLDLVKEQSQGGWNIGSECAKKLFGKDIDKYCTR